MHDRIRIMEIENNKRLQLGPVAQKILLLLAVGASLSLTKRPDKYFRIIKSARKEWSEISSRSLHEAIRNLYRSQMIDYKEGSDGIVTMTLTVDGKRKVLKYDLEKIEIKKPSRWDGLWRIIMFDIPENKKIARNALGFKLRKLGFYPLQKSVYAHPFDCKDEIDFIAEIFEVKPYVRFVLAKDIDIGLKLKKCFKLI